MTTHLVIGGGGQIGAALSARLRGLGHDVIVTTRDGTAGPLRLDLESIDDDWNVPISEDVVYLCAALTNLAACDADPRRARAVNVDGPVKLSEKLARTGAFCVFLSSNAVFDGSRPYPGAADSLSPSNGYGRLKAETETALANVWGSRLAVLRLTKVLHAKLPLVSRWTADLAGRQPISAFGDMNFAPVTMGAAIDAIIALAAAKTGGICHLSGENDVSYFSAAVALAREMGVPDGLVKEGSWRDVPGLVVPPSATALGMGPRERGLGLAPQPLRKVVQALVAEHGTVAQPRAG